MPCNRQQIRRRRQMRLRAYLEGNRNHPYDRNLINFGPQELRLRNRNALRHRAGNHVPQLRARRAVGNNVEHMDDMSDTSDAASSNGNCSDGGSSDGESSIAESLRSIRNITLNGLVTVFDHLLAICAIILRCRQTYICALYMLQWMKVSGVAPEIPTSMYLLRKELDWDESDYTRHAFCGRCSRYFGVYDSHIRCPTPCCINQPSKVSYFLQTKIYPQLQLLLKLPHISKALRYREERVKTNPTAIEDIFDSKEYKKLTEPGNFLHYKYNFSFTLNTDGCSVSKSSKAGVWPMFLRINEFHPLFRKKHLLLAGVFCDVKKPDMNLYMKYCLGELKELYRDGIEWTTSDGEQIRSRCIVVNFSTDTVARPLLLNMKQFNGAFGCGFCFQEGTRDVRNPGVRVYPRTPGVEDRTDASMRRHMTTATLTRQPQFGIKGSSFLRILPLFNLVKGSIIDCMHCVYLGVIKKHTKLFLTSTNKNWYIGTKSNMTLIDKRLAAIKTPSCITRTPRSIFEYKLWKASEWRNWLLYYCIPCLKNILPSKYLRHLSLLSQAMFILEQDSIDSAQLTAARVWLRNYRKNFEIYFGVKNMVYNVHLLTHLVDCVENWGPSWCNSAFIFESWNHRIIQSVTSPNSRALQIADRFMMLKTVAGSIYDETVSDVAKDFIAKLFPSFKYNRDPIVFSNENEEGQYYPACTPRELRTCDRQFFYDVNYRGINYRQSGKNPDTKFCDSYIYCDGIGFAEIIGIVKFHAENENNSGFYAKVWQIIENAMDIHYLHTVRPTQNIVYISFLNNSFKPAVVVSRRKDVPQSLIIKLPNIWEND